MDAILAVNAGSSSLKFQIFAVSGRDFERRVRGQLDGIGTRPRLRASDADGAVLIDRSWEPGALADLPAAIAEVRGWLRTLPDVTLRARSGGPLLRPPRFPVRGRRVP